MRTVAIIQSRLGSTRFPMKALADIDGRPMIAHVVERAQRIRGVDEVCIATVPTDAAALAGWGCNVYAPAFPEDDVLARYSWVKTRLGAHIVIRITGDCPMVDPEEASAVVAALGEHDYISNRRPGTDGLDVEVMTAKALHRADDEATTPYDREHVTPYIYTSGLFDCAEYRGRSIPNGEKWSVDTLADLELVRTRMVA